MKRKNLTLLHFAFLLTVSVAVFSCSKDDAGNSVSLPDYLPTSISSDGIQIDSFQYNSNYDLTKILYPTGNNTWDSYYTFRYDSKHNLTGYSWYNNNTYSWSDTIVYKDGKILDIYPYMQNSVMVYDTTVFSVDGSNRIVLMGSKDTVRGSDFKSLNYTEFSFNGENLSQVKALDYYNSGYTNLETDTWKYEFGNKLNPFYYVFAKCPAIAVIFQHWDNMSFLPVGKNNITKATETYSYNTSADQSIYTINNYYLSGTDFFNKQEVVENGNTTTLTYNLVRTVK